jgi:hypothetical protein
MNRNWERRHVCRRVAVVVRKFAGKDASAPSMATGSWLRCVSNAGRRGHPYTWNVIVLAISRRRLVAPRQIKRPSSLTRYTHIPPARP